MSREIIVLLELEKKQNEPAGNLAGLFIVKKAVR